MRTDALLGGVSPRAPRPLRAGAARADGRPALPRRPRRATPWSFGFLLLFLAMLFANLPLLVPALEAVAPAQTLAVAALLVLFVERAASRQPIRLAWPESHLLLLFLGVAAISSFTALWPKNALENTLMLAKYAAVYVLIVNTVDGWRRLRITYGVLALGATVAALGAFHNQSLGRTDNGRIGWIGIFGNPNDLAYTMVLLVPLGLALATVVRGWRRWLLIAAAVPCLLAAFLTYSRGGLLALGVVLLLCLLRWARPALRIPVLAVAVAALAFVVPSHWDRREGLGGIESDYTIFQRLGTFRAGLAMVADRPLLGVGPGGSVIGFPEYAPTELLSGGWLHIHNTFIEVLAETGVLGATVYLLLLGTALLKARRLARRYRAQGRRDLHRLVSALEISLWGFVACSMAGGYLLSWFPYFLIALVSAASAIPEPVALPAAPARPSMTPWQRSARPCAASPAS